MVQLDEEGNKVGEGCSHSLYPQFVYQTFEFHQELLDRLEMIEIVLNPENHNEEDDDEDDPEEVVDNMEYDAPQED